MKPSILKNFSFNIPAAVAIIGIMVFSNIKQTNAKDNPVSPPQKCCTGYCISINNLRKFMLDSLHGNQFEGGVYSKNDLLNAINNLNSMDDSVYIMNILVNCNVAKGTALAITSRHTPPGVSLVSRTENPCPDCPPMACCPKNAGIARISRDCIDYQSK